ncbi:MAG: hypothetical protein E7304_12710 [Butyrivibrio sp.]|jgi:hypothetical protein|uniref:hypothetical protein n=1 Tax=Butyrivibrio sp. TaxID=28121 RepID=UPI001ECADEC8|nr:hypothetical protein [Butyrivibrio sp.]MBE5842250.1 hypothetical protein [Butyrivibrio sp.]MCR4757810.1 hypothetical protein [Butyrivibrio sp.]
MASYNRADTINSLAMAMGVKPVLDYKKNKYNTATGTIYCNGTQYSPELLSQAIAYFETMRSKARSSLASNSEMIVAYCEVAVSALKELQDKRVEEMGNTK